MELSQYSNLEGVEPRTPNPYDELQREANYDYIDITDEIPRQEPQPRQEPTYQNVNQADGSTSTTVRNLVIALGVTMTLLVLSLVANGVMMVMLLSNTNQPCPCKLYF
jgi:hypothetical protein